MKIQNLEDLFLIKIKSLYDVETQIIKALPKMAKKATDPDLKKGFFVHLEETKQQAKRLEQVFTQFGAKAQKTKVEAIRGAIADTEWLIKNVDVPEVLDAGLVAAAQYVEHYEMAGYGTVVEWAKLLGEDKIAKLLQQTLDEEKATDEKLNKLALSAINESALAEEA